MPLQTSPTYELTPQQLEQLQAEDSYLRGSAALEVLNKAVKETGAHIPIDYVFRDREAKLATKAIHATFELIGGVPAMMLWASKNPTEFYRIYAKQAPTENHITGAGNIQIVTQLPSSPLDDKKMDSRGFVTTIVRDAEEDDDE